MIRIGVIGVGGMGNFHLRNILGQRVARCKLTAICDIVEERMHPFDDVRKFVDSRELIRSGEVDAVLVATPHYGHTTIGIDALEQGLHVLVEKPISVHKADAERLIAAHKDRNKVFAAMFNQRTDPHYQRIKKLVGDGELGEIQRTNWIITNWFRPEAYYASGGWRATWKGEGGGVLVNQCPHNLDLFQWICGMPSRVTGFCSLGKYHDIEVEDEVTACFEYPNGATGVFVTSTGEHPGSNRLEIAGDRGKIVYEGETVRFYRNEVAASVFSKETPHTFATPGLWNVEIPVNGYGGQHLEILQNFIDAALDGKPLIAPAEEGIHSVELANAMLYSSLMGETVKIPLDGAAFEKRLQRLIAESRHVKKAAEKVSEDMTGSFR
ncbi:MAG TPA: Gfo/Idh/MocA family oxidoreductase [Sumerlaeia bacterium]|nr:Gfo/Idh/MocA family oxidoreductase [Sumerlaeia bacterium]